MKKIAITFAAAVLCAVAATAKDIKTLVVTTNPQMHCTNCENKIKNGLRFEKGVKDITTDIPSQTVTVKYDDEKTTEANLTKAFSKIGYQVTKKQAPAKKDAKTADKKGSKGDKAVKDNKKAKDSKKAANKDADAKKKVKKTRVDGNTGASQQYR